MKWLTVQELLKCSRSWMQLRYWSCYSIPGQEKAQHQHCRENRTTVKTMTMTTPARFPLHPKQSPRRSGTLLTVMLIQHSCLLFWAWGMFCANKAEDTNTRTCCAPLCEFQQAVKDLERDFKTLEIFQRSPRPLFGKQRSTHCPVYKNSNVLFLLIKTT